MVLEWKKTAFVHALKKVIWYSSTLLLRSNGVYPFVVTLDLNVPKVWLTHVWSEGGVEFVSYAIYFYGFLSTYPFNFKQLKFFIAKLPFRVYTKPEFTTDKNVKHFQKFYLEVVFTAKQAKETNKI